MNVEEVMNNFCLLNEENQGYIIGILQALVFAQESQASVLSTDQSCAASISGQ